MLPVERLPPELWLIIFELAGDSSTDPQQYCNYLTFPHLNLHLRRPSEHAFTIHQWPLTFRLICRYFNSLLKQPAPFFMKDSKQVITAATRALYILPQRDPAPQACLQRLFADPSICSRITLLNLSGPTGFKRSLPTNFDLLCDNAHSLPAVRSLTLCIRTLGGEATEIPRFWFRLNNAFPLLATFVLRGVLSTTSPHDAVVFKHLEAMHWELVGRHPILQFPALRHASFGSIYIYRLKNITHRSDLESLLLRGLSEGAGLDWGPFPNLRLLGLPAQRTTDAFPPLPPDHPLEHLYVFVGTRPRDDHKQRFLGYDVELTWLVDTIERMPTITRLSLWFDKHRQNHLNWISGYFRKEDLELLGFAQQEFSPGNYENGYHIVFERVKVEPPLEAETITSGEPVPQRRGFRAGWNKFVQSTSRLHI